jgi:hypothetical protein
MRVLCALLASLLLAAGAAHAADKPAPKTTPESVVREYMTALKERGMTAVTPFLHPDELERFKAMLLPILKTELAGKGDLTRALFGNGITPAALDAKSALEFMDTFMVVLAQQMKDFTFDSIEVLGSVQEGEITHVITRTLGAGPNGMTIKALEVQSLKPHGGAWKLLLSGQVEAIGEALKLQLQQK